MQANHLLKALGMQANRQAAAVTQGQLHTHLVPSMPTTVASSPDVPTSELQ
jgi:hypothetical protein